MLNLQHYIPDDKTLLFFLARHKGVSEFEIFRRAYREWYGDDIPDQKLERGESLPGYVRRYLAGHKREISAIDPASYPFCYH